MAASDVEAAERFRLAVEEAVRTGRPEPVYPLLANDVEWVTPFRTFRGRDNVKWELRWIRPAETFDYEFRNEDWVDRGDGVLVCRVHETHRLKTTGEIREGER